MILDAKLPGSWQLLRLADIAAPEKGSLVSGPFGSNISKKFFVESGVPVIRGNNLTLGMKKFIDNGFVFITDQKAYELRNCRAIPRDIIFTAAGTLGQVGIIPDNPSYPFYIISNKQLRLRCNLELVNPVYVYYWFSAPEIREYVANQNTGSSIPLITLGTLRSFPIKIPPIPIQNKIAAILSAYDDLIENNTRRIRVLEAMAQAIYREWFVEFRYPGHEGARLTESPLGPIPEGWEVRKFGEVIELAYGKSLTSENRKEGAYPVFGSAGIVGSHNEYLVNAPGIVVGRKGNVGSVYWTFENFYPIDTVFYVKSALPLYYVYFDLQRQNFINNDAAVPGLSRNQAYLLPMLIPPHELLEKFQEIIAPLFEHPYILRKKNDNLRQQRDMLLPRLISGELEIENLELPEKEE